MSEGHADKPPIEFKMAESLDYVAQVHPNVGQTVFFITEDKIRLCLHGHLQYMEARAKWVAPAGISLTLLIALGTSDFHDRFYVKGDQWRVTFVVCLVLSIIWLLRTLRNLASGRSIDDIVREMKPPLRSASPGAAAKRDQ